MQNALTYFTFLAYSFNFLCSYVKTKDANQWHTWSNNLHNRRFRKGHFRIELIWFITQPEVVNYYWRFGTIYRSHPQFSRNLERMGPIGCPETSTRNCHYWLRNKPEECSSQVLRVGSLKSRQAFLELKFKQLPSELNCSMVISCPFLGKKGWFTPTDHVPSTKPATKWPWTGQEPATNRPRTCHSKCLPTYHSKC